MTSPDVNLAMFAIFTWIGQHELRGGSIAWGTLYLILGLIWFAFDLRLRFWP